MKLHEYQTKEIFAQLGIPIPKGKVAIDAEEAYAAAEELGGKVAIKAQVLVGGRGKAGGIKLVHSPQEARQAAEELMRLQIKGMVVHKVLVEEAVAIDKEIYLGMTHDRAAAKPVLIASSAGGIEIEEVARQTPQLIAKVYINPLIGFCTFHALEIAQAIQLSPEYWQDFTRICRRLWEAGIANDATLVEINPLVLTKDSHFLALDGKMIVDDNAVYRHPELEEMEELDVASQAEIEAHNHGISYIQLDGNIGCMVNGAGLAMATMDLIKQFGGEPANFLDIGGGANSQKVAAALRLILSDPQVKAILINIFGGITRCDEVARGLLSVLKEKQISLPLIVRLVGANGAEGRQMLMEMNIITAESLTEAARKAVEAAKLYSLT